MPSPGTNIAVNKNFDAATPTSGWTKFPIVTGYKVSNRLKNWCNTLGTASDGAGGRELVSTANDVPTGTSVRGGPVVQPTVIAAESTPGASVLCGTNYVHSGSGFTYVVGDVYRIRMTVKRVSANHPDPDATRDLWAGAGSDVINDRDRPRLFVTSPTLSNSSLYDFPHADDATVVHVEPFSALVIDAGDTATVDFEFKIPYWLYGADNADTYIEYYDAVLNPAGEQLHLQVGWEEETLYEGWGVTFAVLPGWELTYVRSDAVPPVYPTGPIGPPGTPGPLGPPTTPPDTGPTGPDFTIPVPPVPTFSAAPVVTFPYGCSDPSRIHVEFDLPTWDRSPFHIPDHPGELEETSGWIEPGVLPQFVPPLDQWFGLGVVTLDLFADGVFFGPMAAPLPGDTHVSRDVPTGFAPPIDLTVDHEFSVRVGFEDIPAWITFAYTFGLATLIHPPEAEDTTPRWRYIWTLLRGSDWPTGFDPGGGLDWGPFGADVPLIPLLNGDSFIVGGDTDTLTTPMLVYDFFSPSAPYHCQYTGFFDPAAGGTTTSNDPPGTGGNPTATGGVTLSTDWACRDSQSFKITAAHPATAPFDTGGAGSGGEPAYLEFDAPFGDEYDVWYYQSVVLFIPNNSGLATGDVVKVMGVRDDPSAGFPTWDDLMTGLALHVVGAEFYVDSFIGSADINSGSSTDYFGPHYFIKPGQHCLQLALRRESDTSGTRNFHLWQYQVDELQSSVIGTRSTYNLPRFAEWGIIDNGPHEPLGGSPEPFFYLDDLRFDIRPFGCRCTPLSLVAHHIPHHVVVP